MWGRCECEGKLEEGVGKRCVWRDSVRGKRCVWREAGGRGKRCVGKGLGGRRMW